jgi:putative YphP/YqiW family bacilliredoxin
MYPPELVAPMKAELTQKGFKELLSSSDVDESLKTDGTTLVVVNSVCGCAAGSMRPAVNLSLENGKLPKQLTTAFAGVDREAVDRARQYMLPYPPSSPCIALFKDGKLAHMIERHHIEGRTAEMIANNLKLAYDEFC